MCTKVLENLNTSTQWPHKEEKNTMYDKIAQRLFWHYIAADINEYIKSFKKCKKQVDLKSPKVELKSIPVPSSVMKQAGVDGHL